MRESAVWRKYVKPVTKQVGGDWQRIESGLTGGGIPDINACRKGKEIWIELKVVDGRRVKMRPEQVGWHLRRARAGGVTFILAYHERLDVFMYWPGRLAREVKRQGVGAAGSSRIARHLLGSALLRMFALQGEPHPLVGS